jgi:surface carbohydrate biosynthesis protein
LHAAETAEAASTLILPVENQVRELDAKLLLACVAVERGFPVILGSRTFVNFAVPAIRRGVFVAKSLRSRSALLLNLIRDLGHDLVAWDEESLVRFNSDEYYTWRFSPGTFKPVSHLFAWGPDDAAMFSAYPGYRVGRIHVTGNPRVDLLRSEVRDYFRPASEALRDRFGDFVLLNTNFSFVNAFVRKLNLILPPGMSRKTVLSRTAQGMSVDFARGMAGHQQAIFDAFRALLPVLSERFPGRNIVLRPHPSEDHAPWLSLAAGLGNVHILHEGNVVPWLMACSVLLHNGCTTAVEAAVLRTPAITYRPVTSQCFDYALPNSLSYEARTEHDVCELLELVLRGRLGPCEGPQRDATLNRHLEATDGRLASDRVIDVLLGAGYGTAPPPRPPVVRALAARVVAGARTALKRVNMRRRGHWNSAEYHAHRFPDIGAGELNARISRFRDLLGRFDGIGACQVSPYLFSIGGPGAGPGSRANASRRA